MSDWYPGATARPITGHTDGPLAPLLGAVLHVNESNGNLYNWVSGDHDVSCHFEVYKDGTVEQYLPVSASSWCQKAGNSTYVSIETEGYTTEPLTAAQLATCAGILSWLHDTHQVPLQLAEIPGEKGFGWHGMGAAHGVDWGHALCPGDIRKAQRDDILKLARPKAPAVFTYYKLNDKGAQVRALQNKLVDLGFAGNVDRTYWVDGFYGPETVAAVKAAKKALHWPNRFGSVGRRFWRRLSAVKP